MRLDYQVLLKSPPLKLLAVSAPDLASLVADEIWLEKRAYLADIFNLITQISLSLQGRDANMLFSQNKITAFIKKINI